MEVIKDTIKSVMSSWQRQAKGVCRRNPETLLKKALTKKELEHIKFNYFRNGILGLKVDSSGWLYQINLRKEKVLIKLRQNLTDIKDIRLRLGG